MNYDEAIRSLQDTAVVIAEIQRRQSEVQKTQAGLAESLLEFRQQTENNLAHVVVRLAEVTRKLAALRDPAI
jgi:N-acetylglutamate synthase/N-acetylornithine aminotransferase